MSLKKIQDGLIYNTGTATFVAVVSNGYDEGNFNYWVEKLYRTDNGRWFVHKAGGGNTPYATKHWDGMSFGELIEVLDEAGVKSWLERNNLVKAYEKYFGNEIKDA